MSDDISSRPGKMIPQPQPVLFFEPFRFDMAARRLYRGDVEVHLVPKAAAVLWLLLERRGRTVSKDEFFDVVWPGIHVSDESLTQTISTVRQALGDAAGQPEFIQTAPGKGYRFIAPARGASAAAKAALQSSAGNFDGRAAEPAREEPPLFRVVPDTSRGPPSSIGHWRWALPWLIAASSLAVTLGIWLLRPTPSVDSAAPRVTRFTETLPPGRRLHVGDETGRRWGANPNFLALSPDGRYLVYVAREGEETQQLYLRPLDGDASLAQPIAGTEGAASPFFSPDGQWLGFTMGGTLYRVPVTGGLPQRICEASGAGASWGLDQSIAFAPDTWLGISLTTPESGSQQRIATTVDITRRENGHRDPVFMPDGKTIVYTRWLGGGRDADKIGAVSPETTESKIILERASGARYLRPGYLSFVRGGQLQAQAFDATTLEVSGTPVSFYETERGLYDASSSGDIAYIPMQRTEHGSEFVWVDHSGRETPLTRAEHIALQSAVSPDGTRIAVAQVESDGEQDVWILDAVGESAAIQVTFDGNSAVPEWSADGRSVIYNSDQRGPWETFRVLADGTGEPELLIEGDSLPYHWHPRLPHVVFRTDEDLWVLDLDSSDGPRHLLAEEGRQGAAKFSADGRWMLYTSSKEGEREIFVRSYPDLANRIKVSQGGGHSGRWAPDGGEIYYANGDQMMAVAIDYNPDLTAGVPRVLFTMGERFARPTGGSDYDVGPDGRFVMVKAIEEPVRREIEIVLNWVEEVKELIEPDGESRGRRR